MMRYLKFYYCKMNIGQDVETSGLQQVTRRNKHFLHIFDRRMVGKATSVSEIHLLIPVSVSNFVLDTWGSPFALEEEMPAAIMNWKSCFILPWLGGQKDMLCVAFILSGTDGLRQECGLK